MVPRDAVAVEEAEGFAAGAGTGHDVGAVVAIEVGEGNPPPAKPSS